MMWSTSGFNGDFRRKPIVSNRGASKKETKEQLLKRAQMERGNREKFRLETFSATLLSSAWRSFVVRRREKERLRSEWESEKGNVKNNVKALEQSLSKIMFVFEKEKDFDRLVWCCQQCILNASIITPLLTSSSSSFRFLLPKLHWTCLTYLSSPNTDNRNINPILRLYEVFNGAVSWPVLVRKGFFNAMRVLVDGRIPDSLEEFQGRAPTPMADTLFKLLMAPLKAEYEDKAEASEMYLRFTESFLSRPFSLQVRLFILPALRQQTEFSYLDWLFSLRNLSVTESPCWLLYSVLYIGSERSSKLETLGEIALLNYLTVLSKLCSNLAHLRNVKPSYGAILAANSMDCAVDSTLAEEEDSDSEEGDEDDLKSAARMSEAEVRSLRESLVLLNKPAAVFSLISCVEASREGEAVRLFCQICHSLLMADKSAIHKFKLLNTLAFKPGLIHRLWNALLSARQPASMGGGHPIPLLTVISRGLRVSPSERDNIVPLLAVFSSVFSYLLVTVDDNEFASSDNRGSFLPPTTAAAKQWMPFSLRELVPMSLALRDVTLGLIELAFPESRPTIREDYQMAVREAQTNLLGSKATATTENDTHMWSHLFRATVDLLRHLYTRDTRRMFCPENHWICPNIHLPLDRSNDISLRRSRMRQYRPFRGLRLITREELEVEGPPLSTKEVRLATVLREMPYAISFSQRVLVFSNLVTRHKQEHQGEAVHFHQGPSISLLVRRNYLYEDSFDKLSPENEPNVCLKMRIQMMNAAGMDEAGIDGGGLFREFMTELLKTAFDPNRGFFRLTNDHQLYPNPSVEQIEKNFIPHYYFIGRMVGKALYENHLVELPLASFFLSKLLGQRTVNVDIDHLSSLDPELYKNLLYLKTYDDKEVADLGLDFTIVSEEIGQTHVEELKPGGADIAVDSNNRIEYIHLVADYKLNRQIRAQCNAFRNGLSDVINLDWLRMFSYRELQTLISGAEHDINVDDLRVNTKYGNGFDDDHPTVNMFWKVVVEMTENQRRCLLKFVTSCSRPPLLGFKELYPPFCIHHAGSSDSRLPTASTCMNLLKLSEFRDEAALRDKLLYAIESGAGFELS